MRRRPKARMRRLWLFALPVLAWPLVLESAGRPVPSPAVLKRIEAGFERYGIVHFSINTFTDREWGYGNESPALFNPTAFDANQIVGACKDGGLQGLIVVAKHHDGFCLWPTKTTEHNIAKTPFWRSQGPGVGSQGRDYVKEMEQACRRAGIKFGVYCSPWDRNNAHYATDRYVKIFHEQIRELLDGRYGDVFELWLDNANGGDGYYGGVCERRKIPIGYYRLDDVLRFVRASQPDVCIFNEDEMADFRWPGNESGILDENCRATGLRFDIAKYDAYMAWADKGTIEGVCFHPPEADFPLRQGWFYHAAHDGFDRSPEFLMKIYLRTCGNGGAMNVGIAPDRRGLLPDEDVNALRGFEAIRQAFFGRKVASGDGFNVVVMKEDVSLGERIDGWELVLDGRVLTSGRSIGIKRIRVLGKIEKGVDLKVCLTKSFGKPGAVVCELFAVDPELVRKVMQSEAPEPPKASFENVGIPTLKMHSSQVYMFKGTRMFSSVTVAPDKSALGGTPVVFRLSFSMDGETWKTDPGMHRLDNVGANPIPQTVTLGRIERARYVRLEAERLLQDGARLSTVGLTLGD